MVEELSSGSLRSTAGSIRKGRGMANNYGIFFTKRQHGDPSAGKPRGAA